MQVCGVETAKQRLQIYRLNQPVEPNIRFINSISLIAFTHVFRGQHGGYISVRIYNQRSSKSILT